MENKVPTTKQYLQDIGLSEVMSESDLIEFAKFHCKAQLEAILKKVRQEIACDKESTEHFNRSVKPSIINAYNLNNIK